MGLLDFLSKKSGAAPAAVDTAAAPAVAAAEPAAVKPTNAGSAKEVLHTVAAGETLWKIAEKHYGHGHGAKYTQIFEANKPLLSDPDEISPGQVLRIPGSSGPVASAAPASAATAAASASASAEWKPPQEISSAAATSGAADWKPPSEIAGKTNA